ncbi:MAG: outer membrane protein assembly factor BamD, partial [Pseudomonadales bacterium]|nr:outer membrane protein assembly factor BamD [Pseudomonadales bacterium]
MQRFLKLIISCLLIPVLFTACASNQNQFEQYSEDELYQISRQYMVDNKFSKAISAYQALETRFPFGQYAEQAQLEIISAYYQGLEYDAAVSSADRFTRLHPDHPNADFAIYYKGLSNFDANRSLFDRFFDMDMSKRDLGTARDSFQDFAELVSKYPDSRFAADSRGRMIFLRNLMARGEIHIADHYFQRGSYAAAANRGRFVVEHYQATPAVADGLAVMIQAYRLMDMPELEQDSLKTLKQNFPDHYALDDDGNFKDNYQLKTSENINKTRGIAGYSN